MTRVILLAAGGRVIIRRRFRIRMLLVMQNVELLARGQTLPRDATLLHHRRLLLLLLIARAWNFQHVLIPYAGSCWLFGFLGLGR